MWWHGGGDDVGKSYFSAEDGRIVKIIQSEGNYIAEYSNVSVGTITEEDVTIPNLDSYDITIGRNLQ